MNINEMYSSLSQPFAPEVERSLTKSGTRLTYIPVSEVINRLNRTIGVDNWSSQILKAERDALDPDFIVAHVRVTAMLNGQSVTRDGFGGQKIKRTRSGDIVDLGDEYKGAVSDAFKKACQLLGVGLYLARSEEAIELDEEPLETPPPSQVDVLYENFMSLRNRLDSDGVEELRSYWKTWSGGRPVPKRPDFTEEELEILIAECTRLLLGGEYVAANE